MSKIVVHERDMDFYDGDRPSKKVKIDENMELAQSTQDAEIKTEDLTASFSAESVLPASRSLLPHRKGDINGEDIFRLTEQDVGISEYISHDVPKIAGIIKQRCATK
jgi:tRNA pseudouridine13 synthase